MGFPDSREACCSTQRAGRRYRFGRILDPAGRVYRKASCGAAGCMRLIWLYALTVQVQTYEEGVGCGVWILGKWMEPKRIQAAHAALFWSSAVCAMSQISSLLYVQALIPPDSLIIDFAVPHVSEDGYFCAAGLLCPSVGKM